MSKSQKPRSTKKFALMGLLAVMIIATASVSIYAFNDNSVGITGNDAPSVSENSNVIAHYELTGNDVPEFSAQTINPNEIVPVIEHDKDGRIFGGTLLVQWFDAQRNLIGVESTHNRVTDEGETFLLDQIFQDGAIPESADGDLMSSICVTIEVGFVDTDELETANGFDTGNTTTETNCIEDTVVGFVSSVATIGPLTFDAPTHVGAGDEITGFAVCQGSASSPFADCEEAQAGSSGVLLAVIDTADRTLQSAETVDVTYTFDISSAGS